MKDQIKSLVFTGHMTDLPDRATPRFPPILEAAARQQICRCVSTQARPGLIGISSAARGGDILFHEACRAQDIATTIILPFPPEVFVKTSLEGVAVGNWVERFWALWHSTPKDRREILDLPQNSSAYTACNLRLIEVAVSRGFFHLIALWDGKDADGPGGTAHMIAQVKQATDTPDIIRPQDLAIGRTDR